MPESDSQASPTSLNSKQRHGMTTRLENLGITFSAYRSNKMSWMLLANAIALAREGCYFEIETRSLLDSINNDKTANRDWAHVICVFIYLADEHLALRLDLEPLLPESSRKIVVHRLSKMFTRALPEKEHWESYFELTEEMRKAREYLHELKQTASRPYSYDLVPILEYTQRRLERWKRQFERLGKDRAINRLS
ncbi:zinc finger transcriptional activator [Fusarium falciforme]|nr:zinc finger transcriptional activator [Fusarium falciforme]KAJ4258293.1 zinc finger transcriptional activator [Fusarium falciforme]